MPKEKSTKVKELEFILEQIQKLKCWNDNHEALRQFVMGYITGLIFKENETGNDN